MPPQPGTFNFRPSSLILFSRRLHRSTGERVFLPACVRGLENPRSVPGVVGSIGVVGSKILGAACSRVQEPGSNRDHRSRVQETGRIDDLNDPNDRIDLWNQGLRQSLLLSTHDLLLLWLDKVRDKVHDKEYFATHYFQLATRYSFLAFSSRKRKKKDPYDMIRTGLSA